MNLVAALVEEDMERIQNRLLEDLFSVAWKAFLNHQSKEVDVVAAAAAAAAALVAAAGIVVVVAVVAAGVASWEMRIRE
jgi:hypothetical protein